MQVFSRRRFHLIWRYLRGDTPWDSGIVPPEIVTWIEDAESNGLPPGRALDLGCGTGTTSIFLVGRGWDVVGIDFVPDAIHRARRKARQAALTGSVTFHCADVSRLDFLNGVFDLVIDVGCLHGLTLIQRRRYAAHVTRLTRPGATYLLYAFQPYVHQGRQRGITPQDVETLFAPAFVVQDVTLGEDVTAPISSGWYTLRHTEVLS